MEDVNGVLFSIGPLEVTGRVVTMWVIIAVISLASFLATRRLRDVPGPLQNLAELAVEKLRSFFSGNLSPENARRYLPVMGTFFIFILVSNYSGLLPGAGKLFAVPTSGLSVTAGLAVVAFFFTHYAGIRRRGLAKYLKSFLLPFFLMLDGGFHGVAKTFAPSACARFAVGTARCQSFELSLT